MTFMKEAAFDKTEDLANKSRDDKAQHELSRKSGNDDWEEETPSVSKSELDDVGEETGLMPDDRDGLVDNKVWTSLSDE
jgi:hypothetical protein